jgi:hypothetical protein
MPRSVNKLYSSITSGKPLVLAWGLTVRVEFLPRKKIRRIRELRLSGISQTTSEIATGALPKRCGETNASREFNGGALL